MKFHAQGVTNVGLVRNQNEDSLLIDLEHGVFAVADGVGGMPGGDVASAAAVAGAKNTLSKEGKSALDDLPLLVELAHHSVRAASNAFPGGSIATTFTLAHVADGRVRIAHVGDSFALLVRGGACRPLTREHNVENERSDVESIAPYPSRYRYALTRVLGQLEPLVADVIEEDLQADDWLIIATDGLTDMVEFFDIAAICSSAAGAEEVCAALLEAALGRGGHDNITFIVLDIEEV